MRETTGMTADPARSPGVTAVPVWDLPTRLFKWGFALAVAVSWTTGQLRLFSWHFRSGYVVIALLVFRLLWGLVGSDSARFARFLRGPGAAWRHLAAVRRGEADRDPGPNPAGGLMVVLLLGLVVLQLGTGLFSDDGVLAEGPLAARVSAEASDFLGMIHVRVQKLILAAVVLHLLAVLTYRVIAGRDLVWPMLTGIKPLPAETGAGAIEAPRMAPPARALLCAAVAIAATWGLLRLGS